MLGASYAAARFVGGSAPGGDPYAWLPIEDRKQAGQRLRNEDLASLFHADAHSELQVQMKLRQQYRGAHVERVVVVIRHVHVPMGARQQVRCERQAPQVGSTWRSA